MEMSLVAEREPYSAAQPDSAAFKSLATPADHVLLSHSQWLEGKRVLKSSGDFPRWLKHMPLQNSPRRDQHIGGQDSADERDCDDDHLKRKVDSRDRVVVQKSS
ncbi:hypothetical protein MFFC18_09180 [Mariniblastus fucicola]|uniref:Uncharacterized protein n=1 Tax=Mariniblastus fucicola TaxID=980251 RepID=A0A5B9P8W4_9BACT|nr:hypothetical protein MFFC18_09180 [Mariniblastus fucicola]